MNMGIKIIPSFFKSRNTNTEYFRCLVMFLALGNLFLFKKKKFLDFATSVWLVLFVKP